MGSGEGYGFSRGGPNPRLLDTSKAVVFLAESVLVLIARFFGYGFGIVKDETGCVPLFHFDHRVVIVGQCLFDPDSVDPGIYGLLVLSEKMVEILVFHVMEIYGSVGTASTDDDSIHERLTQRGLIHA
jgi:hypothetical protein